MLFQNQNIFAAQDQNKQGPGPAFMGAKTLIGNEIYNAKEEHLGEVKEIMLDVHTGKVSYVVMQSGGILTIGEKLFAIHWDALKLDTVKERFILDVDKSRFDNATGFDADNWPKSANLQWGQPLDGLQNYSTSGVTSHIV